MYLCIIWPPVCTFTLSFAQRSLWAFALAPSAIAGLASCLRPCLSHAGTLIHRCQLRCCRSVAQSCPTRGDPMDCSTPGLPVHHQLPEYTQTYIYWVGDAIQPSHPLLSSSPPTFNLPSIRVFSSESVICISWPNNGVSAQHQSFQWTFRTDFL